MPNDNLFDGKFKLGPIIGTGGFGVVHRATQAAFDREVAIKILQVNFADEDYRRFEREAELSARSST